MLLGILFAFLIVVSLAVTTFCGSYGFNIGQLAQWMNPVKSSIFIGVQIIISLFFFLITLISLRKEGDMWGYILLTIIASISMIAQIIILTLSYFLWPQTMAAIETTGNVIIYLAIICLLLLSLKDSKNTVVTGTNCT
jgi:hypothetical protein